MNIAYVKGDLIEMARGGRFDAVAHGCNCFHTMGSGIAPKINHLSGGKLLNADRKTPYGDINKLGTISQASNVVNGKEIQFFNLYTQHTYGNTDDGRVLVHWDSLFNAIIGVLDHAEGPNIGIPLIGCGLAGGKMEDFESVMTRLWMMDYSHISNKEPAHLTVVVM